MTPFADLLCKGGVFVVIIYHLFAKFLQSS